MTRQSDIPAEASAASPREFTLWPEVAGIETDRFCHVCGYNLHEQSVRREPHTQVLMCRCPECGTFHPVSVPVAALRIWLQRFKGLMVLTWVAIVLSLGFLVGFLHGAAIYFTWDEFTTVCYDPATGRYLDLKPSYQNPDSIWWVVYLVSGLSCFGLAFVGTTLARVFMPHWKTAAHRVVIYLWALLPALIVLLIFQDEGPQLFEWSLPFVAAYVGCYLAGGLLALWIGRGLLRLIVRICVPPGWRVHLEAIRPK